MKSKLLTASDISQKVFRSPTAVASMILRLKIEPTKVELLKGNARKNYFSLDKVNKVITHYNNIDNSDTLTKSSRLRKTPDVIYVTRESHFFESKSNFWSDKKIQKKCDEFL